METARGRTGEQHSGSDGRFVIGRVRSDAHDYGRAHSRECLCEFLHRSVLIESDVVPETLEHRSVEIRTDEAGAAELERLLPLGLAIEPVILHRAETNVTSTETGRPGLQRTLAVRALGANRHPLLDVHILLNLREQSQLVQLYGKTNREGTVMFQFDEALDLESAVVASDSSYWKQVVKLERHDSNVNVDLDVLPMTGPLAWWHNRSRMDSLNLERGGGIRVGVLDTGLADHPHLSHARNLGSFLHGNYLPDNLSTTSSHGTHVAGIIGSRCLSGEGYLGLAPGADLYCARVFTESGGASQADIANGIDGLMDLGNVHLINLSLGALIPSKILQDALLDAFDLGVICICAAGNSSGDVEYPAAFASTVAVGAFGIGGHSPAKSMSNWHQGHPKTVWMGEAFIPHFSCRGPGLGCIGAGVGIISTVTPNADIAAPYGVMDGTSMAAPMITAHLATRLAQDQMFLEMDGDSDRGQYILDVVANEAQSLGFPKTLEGYGLLA